VHCRDRERRGCDIAIAIRKDILDAAAREFGEVGYERARLEDIAKTVGMKKGSLYHHIRYKEDLLFVLHQNLINELLMNTQAAVKQARTSEEALRAIVRVAMRLIAEHREEVTVFLNERHVLGTRRWRAVVAKRDQYQALVDDVIARGIADSSFRRAPVGLTRMALLGMVNWSHQWYRPDGELSSDEIADHFFDTLVHGIGKPRGSGGNQIRGRRQ
jgi:TetR/AcrR family transcriptional regulator, cholesterol catabolism regulator